MSAEFYDSSKVRTIDIGFARYLGEYLSILLLDNSLESPDVVKVYSTESVYTMFYSKHKPANELAYDVLSKLGRFPSKKVTLEGK